jgi:hypothetical protein
MDKQLLQTYLKKPESLDKSSLKELEDLIKEFPYFQTAWVLLAKNLNNLNDHRFENTLRKTATYAPDRGRLFQIIMKDISEKVEPAEKQDKASKADTTGKDSQTKPRTGELKQQTEKAKSEQVQKKKADIREDKNRPPADKPKTTTKPDDKSGEKDLNDVLQQRLNELKKKINHPQETEHKTKESETTELKAEDFFSALPTVSTRNKAQQYSLKELEHNRKPKKTEQAPKRDKTMPRTKKQALLDKFIESENEIEGPRVSTDKETGKRQKTVEQTFENSNELVSDTLAKIYIKQGHYEKALTAYKKLSLKYPQKNIYFASQIEKIKQLIQSKDE